MKTRTRACTAPTWTFCLHVNFVSISAALLTLLFVSGVASARAKHAPVKLDVFTVDVTTNRIVDTHGRTRMFHGMNFVEKEFPWYDQRLLNSTFVEQLKLWGFNCVRLGTMWSGVAPSKGSWNETYIDTIREIVQLMSSNGVYTLLDMHQDVLSSKYGSYDGIPLWLVNEFPPPSHAYPWPLTKISQWALGYVTEAVSQGFQSLYDNAAHARTYWAEFWKKVATELGPEPGVLGYELINEPWCGDIYDNPLLILPGEAGHINLMPSYDELVESIRSVDNQTLIFYEPVTWGVYLDGNVTGTGFNRVPGGARYGDRSVLSYHYYCWLVAGADGKHRYNPLDRFVCDDVLGPQVFRNVVGELPRLGGAAFLTEFGTCTSDGTNDEGSVECEFVLQQTEQHIQNWMYWDGQDSFFERDRLTVNLTRVRDFVRVYPRAVAGTPTLLQFNTTTSVFHFEYTADPKVTEPTEIFVPTAPFRYETGFVVNVTDNAKWVLDHDASTINVYFTADTAQSVHVSVQPKL